MIARVARLVPACLLATLATSAPALGQDAPKLFSDGLAVLAKGDLDAARLAFARAAKADPADRTYADHFALVRRAQQLAALLEREDDAARWEEAAGSLRGFYLQFRVYEAARVLDERRHARAPSPLTAADLAESLLECGRDTAVIELLAAVPEPQRTPRIIVRHSLALARLERTAEADTMLRTCPNVDGDDWRLLRELACLRSRVGDVESAATLLTRSFAMTPPSLLAASKAYASARADLARLRAADAAETVWATASTVQESTCSSGSDCSTCPSREGCDPATEGGA